MLLDEFAAELRARKSAVTRKKYHQAARNFVGFLAASGVAIDCIDHAVLHRYVTWVTTPEAGIRTPSPATVHVLVAGTNAYLKFLRRNGVAIPEQDDPDAPKIPHPLPLVIPRDRIGQYAALALAADEPYGTCCLLLPYSGLRVSEMCSLKIKNVIAKDVGPGDRRYVLHVERGKYSKERMAPVGSGPAMAVSLALEHYLGDTRKVYLKDRDVPWRERWLFPAPHTSHYAAISPDRVERTLADWRKQLALPELHPHLCRSTYATALLSVGHLYDPPIDALEVARYLGHARGVDTLAQHYAGCRYESAEAVFGRIFRPGQTDYSRPLRTP